MTFVKAGEWTIGDQLKRLLILFALLFYAMLTVLFLSLFNERTRHEALTRQHQQAIVQALHILAQGEEVAEQYLTDLQGQAESSQGASKAQGTTPGEKLAKIDADLADLAAQGETNADPEVSQRILKAKAAWKAFSTHASTANTSATDRLALEKELFTFQRAMQRLIGQQTENHLSTVAQEHVEHQQTFFLILLITHLVYFTAIYAAWRIIRSLRIFEQQRQMVVLALAEKEERLQAILDTAAEGIVTIDPQGIVESFNAAAERIFGYDAREILGKNVSLLMSEPQRSEHDGYLRNYLAGAPPKIIGIGRKAAGLRKDGSEVPLAISISETKTESCHVFTGVLRDISVTERQEQELRAKEKRLREIFDAIFGYIALLDEDGRMVLANRRPFELAGIPYEAAMGQRFSESPFFGGDIATQDEICKAIARAWQGEMSRFVLAANFGPTTGIQQVDTVFGPLRNESGEISGILAFGVDITARIAMEKQLRESEERYARVLKGSSDGYWDWNLLTHEDHLSPRWKEILGYRDDELANVETTFFSLIHPDDVERVHQAVKRHIEEFVPYRVELRLKHKDGTYRWIFARGEAERDAEGQVIRMAGTITDISARKETEQRLQESETKYRLLHTSMRDAFVLSDLKGRILELNQIFQEMLAYGREELMDLTIDDLTPIAWRETDERILSEQVMKQGFSEIYRKEFLKKGGIPFPAEIRSFLLKDEKGEILGQGSIVRDISDRVAAEEALKFALQRLNEAQRLARLGSWELDLVQGKLHWSDEIYRIFEIDPEKFAPSYETFLELIHPEDRATVDRAYKDSVELHTPYEITHRLLMHDGRVKHIHERAKTFYAEDGAPIRSVGTVQDVTESVLAEGRLIDSNEQLALTIAALKRRDEEMTQITAMNSLLQSCLNEEEAYQVISEFFGRIFIGLGGALAIYDKQRNQLDSVSIWGGYPHAEAPFEIMDCWALRRGEAHQIGNGKNPISCPHVERMLEGGHLCLPLSVQGEIFGLLSLDLPLAEQESEKAKNLAFTVGEVIKLALSNLRLQISLREQAIVDPLTTLYNRRFLNESLPREMYRCRRKGKEISVVMFDLDHFKRINDLHGHEGGDLVLREIAALLLKRIRRGDLACRYGGEEMTLILSETPLKNAIAMVEGIIEAIRELRLEFRGKQIHLTASAGIATAPIHAVHGEELIRMADQALYLAKQRGRNRICTAEDLAQESEAGKTME